MITQLAAFIVACISLTVIALGLLTIHAALKVIHAAVNSNMTRALDEVTQLHKDVTALIHARDEERRKIVGLQATEKLSGQLINVVDGIAEQQALVARNLRTAQEAVDNVAADLAESHKRADEVHASEPAGTAADAAQQTPVQTKDEG